jgi:SpoVK/Ycf46/Vps4 family AAA+-type ATPase
MALNRKPNEYGRALQEFATFHDPMDAEAPILAAPIRASMRQWLAELSAVEELKLAGLKPRRTALLDGPPGCGKTTLAHHLAARLGLTLAVINMAAISSQWLNQTGQNIHALFREMESAADSCILFLDEFDAIASKRGDGEGGATQEGNKVVIALLQHIDSFDGYMFAATNRGSGIDPAIWRRFAMHLKIEEPDDECRYAILTRYLAPFALPPAAMDEICKWTRGATPALLRGLMEGLKRDLILSPKFNQPTDPVSVFSRTLTMVEPHEDAIRPPLWDSINEKRIAAIAWPPILQPEAKAA